MRKLLLLAFFSTGFLTLSAQDSTKVETVEVSEISMITNRPGVTEASTAVFKGGFQMEVGLEYGKIPNSKGSTDHSEYIFLPNFGFQYGVSKNVELRIFSTNYATRSFVNDGYTKFVFNLSNLYVGTKINLLRSKGLIPELAFVLNQGIPSNPADVRKQWPTTGILAWSYSLPANFGLSGNLGYINHKEVFERNITFNHSWSYSVNVGYSIQNDFGVFVEIFGEDQMNDDSEVPINFDGGVWYRFNPKLQIDASVGYEDELGSYYMNAGFSWLILK